jgi:hypothetical protein
MNATRWQRADLIFQPAFFPKKGNIPMPLKAMLLHCRCEDSSCTCKTPDGEKVKLSGMISAGKYRDVSESTSSSDARVALSPIQAAAQSEDHKALFRSVMASARILRLDIDLSKPIDINQLNAKLSKSSDITQRMALKRSLSLMGCL